MTIWEISEKADYIAERHRRLQDQWRIYYQYPLAETRLAMFITAPDQRQVDSALNTADVDFGLVAINGADLTRNTSAHRCVSSQESH